MHAAAAKLRFLPAAAARARDEGTLTTNANIAEAARQRAAAMRHAKSGKWIPRVGNEARPVM